ncbi:hypothetical protein IMG5_064870 [Ichthyophthirius multifiliis]|uniref:Beta-ureidopropionase n=1 Tax=Ichthyophthirius multifiliis TaxID=5932 RepID=G0QP75_ICHMU|nr:hypothetical protein IMG5_064870 [Ichthyophthirius multifiliis]EGR32979.1 hypothetical protein IMG5_064870 [Ichthyophthirius multifiliis]|eukprot:XP_004036965.1 hypothetical protein IMG5_064870 [Ichthyophthirius multifiliis]
MLTKLPKKVFSTSPIFIKRGTIINHDCKFEGDVQLLNGKILKIGTPGTLQPLSNSQIIDANNKYVIPGGIETHSHLQMPFMGTVSQDCFDTGTRATAAGGTTFLLDFIVPKPKQSLLQAYEQWRKWADPKVHHDFGFHCCITWWGDQVYKEMEELIKLGVVSFKFFLAYKNSLMVTDEEMIKCLERCKELGALSMVHAENGHLVDHLQNKILNAGVTGPEGHYLSRSKEVEAEATHRAIVFANELSTPLYVVHLMGTEAAEEVIRARQKGFPIFGETLASTLGIDGRKYWDKNWDVAAGAVMSPSLSPDPECKVKMMKYLAMGAIHTVGTDNCTFSQAQKRVGKNDFTKIPNGCNGLEDRMSIVWNNGVRSGILSPMDFVRVTSTAGAQIFNVYPQKGRIQEGSDADLVVWDPEAQHTISHKHHHHAHDHNVFEGLSIQGRASTTIAGGNILWDNGIFYPKGGKGKFVERKPFGFPYERMKFLDEERDYKKQIVDRTNQVDVNMEEKLTSLQKELNIAKSTISHLQKQLENSNNNNINNSSNFQYGELISVEKAINEYLPEKEKKEVLKILYGANCDPQKINNIALNLSKTHNFELAEYKIGAQTEQARLPRRVKIGAVQNIYKAQTTDPILAQRNAIHEYNKNILEAAYHCGVNVICFQELWTCPFFVATREKYPWVELAESAEFGPTTLMLQDMAKKYNMVIVSSILERDDERGVIFNTAVVISNKGKYMGKHRKNHIPRVGDFNESTYYMEGNTGHPVFATEFGKIAINICYDRHHPLSWQQFGLNGAEIVFNPSATVGGLSEPMWPIEARNAAIANHYFTVAINRVGTEQFPNKFTSGDGKNAHNDFGHFYGSSYVAAPDGTRTPGLSRTQDGLLVVDIDLNLCQQIKDKWGFTMTGRHDYYAEKLNEYVLKGFKQQLIRDI